MSEPVTTIADLELQLDLMQTMEQLAQVGAWSVELPTFDVTSSPGIYLVFEQDSQVNETLMESMNRCLPEYRPIMASIWEKAFADGEPFSHEIPCLTAKNRVIWVRSIGIPEVENGAVVRIRGVLVDITAEHQALENVQQLNSELERRVVQRTASLAAVNAELESFSYSVSHDLRSPLRAITGFAELLEDRLPESLDPKAAHYLNNIVTAGQRMGTLIEQLLEYSTIGGEAFAPRPIELTPTVQRLVETFAERIETSSATIDVAADLPSVLGDHTLLDQILSNLIDNALKYRSPGIPVTVSILASAHDDTVQLKVTDNGIGIETQYHERIFEVFQRLHTDEEYPGTGIGLASARKAAERMGGTLTVESSPGAGCVFTLTLPSTPVDH